MTFIITPNIFFRRRFFDSPDVVRVASRGTSASDELHRQRAPLHTSSPRRLESTHAVDEPHARLFRNHAISVHTPSPRDVSQARRVREFARRRKALVVPQFEDGLASLVHQPEPDLLSLDHARSADVYRRPSALRQLDPAQAPAHAAEFLNRIVPSSQQSHARDVGPVEVLYRRAIDDVELDAPDVDLKLHLERRAGALARRAPARDQRRDRDGADGDGRDRRAPSAVTRDVELVRRAEQRRGLCRLAHRRHDASDVRHSVTSVGAARTGTDARWTTHRARLVASDGVWLDPNTRADLRVVLVHRRRRESHAGVRSSKN